jgi:sugar phosphate isomerase/epimerase
MFAGNWNRDAALCRNGATSLLNTNLPAIGLQLYTLRELMETDLPDTLAAVASLGYANVEFAGYFRHEPADIQRLLQASGLHAPSVHVPPHALVNEPESTLDIAATAGHQYIVLAWWEQPMCTPDGYRQLAELLNHTGSLARDRGLSLAYHNHDFEFSANPEWVPYDFLLRETDPSLVSFELDVYWAVKSHRDPLRLVSSNPDRFPLLHAKDMDRSGGETDIGSGQIDFRGLLGDLPVDTVNFIFVERDEPEAPLDSAALGLARLRDILNR